MDTTLESFVAKSQHTLVVTIYDLVEGVKTPRDLTGSSVKIRVQLPDSTIDEWTLTPDPDQGANPGKCTRELAVDDLEVDGRIYLQAVVTSGGDVLRSGPVERFVERAL